MDHDETCDKCKGRLFLDEATRLADGKLVCEGCAEEDLEARHRAAVEAEGRMW